jgi:hypothetical protein
MKMPHIRTLIIIGQSILLLVCLGYLTVVLVRNYCLKSEATRYAFTAGFEQARHSYVRGHFWLYEIKQYKDPEGTGSVPTDGEIEFAHKTEGQFLIYYYLVSQDFEQGHLEIQKAYVDAYNEHMRQFVDHPEWFDKDGYPIGMHELKQRTNNLGTSKN